jgi:hypothetical protein
MAVILKATNFNSDNVMHDYCMQEDASAGRESGNSSVADGAPTAVASSN